MRTTFIYIVFIFISNFSFSQSIIVKGKVLDKHQKPLLYANIMAEPIDSSQIEFTVTDDFGRFQMRLAMNQKYNFNVSYIGYKPKILTLELSKDTDLDIILDESIEVLDEVKINAKLAVSIKKDTITYQTDKFTSGEERKLRDVLKKLPGVEVDKAGNVSVQGKRVTKVLVEDKRFFTGDSKLAVNNIPADVVDEIEILDNYSEVAILKGLEDSDDMAMNIRLKEGKKRFWFGDIESGTGITDRHLVHPSIFYYSPKTSVNLIGDLNNIGSKSFTFKDYLDFEGGYSKILRNTKAYFSHLNGDFAQFLNDKNFKDSRHSFVAASLNQSLSERTSLIGYVIYSKTNNRQESNVTNQYVNDFGGLFEERISNSNPISTFLIGKAALDNVKEDGTTLKLESFIKASNSNNQIQVSSSFNDQNNFIHTNSIADHIDFKQNIEWYKELSNHHTLTVIGNINFNQSNSLVNWLTDDEVFQAIVPIIADTMVDISKDKVTRSSSVSLLLKDYWVMNEQLHVYTTIGAEYYNDEYNSDEFQTLSTGEINNFIFGDFGNRFNADFVDAYIGSQLKFQRGKFTFKPGVFYHNYSRKLEQFDQFFELNKNYFLPELLVKIDLQRGEKIDLRYNLKVHFPSITRLLLNQTLTNFNSVNRGNPTLENELYHQANVYYYKFSMLKKLNYNVSLNYRKTQEGIRNTAVINDISVVNQPILLDNADESVTLSGNIRKGYGNFNLKIGGNLNVSNYLQVVNDEVLRNDSNSYGFNTGFKTSFEKLPNIEFNYKKSFDNYKTPSTNTDFEKDKLNIALEYQFGKDFNFTLDYNYQKFQNITTENQNQNDILNASLIYSKENSSWSFEIAANNIFNNDFLRNSSFSDFLISDTRTFVLPRIVMCKVSYKL